MICSLPLGDLNAGNEDYCISRLQDTGDRIDHRGDIYNLWRQSVSHIIRQLNHKVALASAVIIPATEWC